MVPFFISPAVASSLYETMTFGILRGVDFLGFSFMRRETIFLATSLFFPFYCHSTAMNLRLNIVKKDNRRKTPAVWSYYCVVFDSDSSVFFQNLRGVRFALVIRMLWPAFRLPRPESGWPKGGILRPVDGDRRHRDTRGIMTVERSASIPSSA